jgi:NADH:ubiquinone oxidoreductase subunit C
MTKEELKSSILELSPDATFDETGEFLTILIASEGLIPLMSSLKSEKQFQFDYLFCLTCIDWKDHLMMVYHLLSKVHKHCIVIKAKITDVVNPKIESLHGLWGTAELNEDEVYDLFGVIFLNHPNLRRLFLEEDWKGHPLRKNYSDENMIKL